MTSFGVAVYSGRAAAGATRDDEGLRAGMRQHRVRQTACVFPHRPAA